MLIYGNLIMINFYWRMYVYDVGGGGGGESEREKI